MDEYLKNLEVSKTLGIVGYGLTGVGLIVSAAKSMYDKKVLNFEIGEAARKAVCDFMGK